MEKIIHQTWKTRDIPARYQPWVESVRSNHTDYQHWIWTDSDNRDFIAAEYPWFLETYDSYNHHIERVDSVRYFLLAHFGGVYLDLDMECIQPITPLLNEDDVFLSMEAGPKVSNRQISNAFMAARRQHPFFLGLINQLIEVKSADVTYTDLLNNTGPPMLERFAIANRERFKFHVLRLDQVAPAGIVSQIPKFEEMDLDRIRQDRLVYLIHHQTRSWNIQMDPPSEEIPGFTLFASADIQGADIAYLDPDKYGLAAYLDYCHASSESIGFNYNGFIKGLGGRLVNVPSDSEWLNKHKIAWICLKDSYLDTLSGA